jgi:hypothetical protein
MANAWVRQENRLIGSVGHGRICGAFDREALRFTSSNDGYDGKDEGVEHSEDGGGVLVGLCIASWEELAMLHERRDSVHEGHLTGIGNVE